MSEFTFTDKANRTWDVSLSLGSVRRIEASDFTEIGYEKKVIMVTPTKELLTEVITNTSLVFAMIWAVVQPQAKSLGVDEQSFIDALDGDTLESGKEAFWRAIANFFPKQKIALLGLIGTYKKAEERIGKKMLEMMPQMTPRLEELVDQEMDKALQEFEMRVGETSIP